MWKKHLRLHPNLPNVSRHCDSRRAHRKVLIRRWILCLHLDDAKRAPMAAPNPAFAIAGGELLPFTPVQPDTAECFRLEITLVSASFKVRQPY